MRVLTIKGTASFQALTVMQALIYGYWLVPGLSGDKTWKEFREGYYDYSDDEKEHILRNAVGFVKVSPEEIETMLSFIPDKNGIPLCAASIKNLDLGQAFEMMIAVLMEMSKIRISFISESEKKNYQRSQSISAVSF